MDEILVNLKNSYLLIPISMILSVILVYIDNIFNEENEVDQKVYVKYALITGLISLIIVYISNIPIRLDEEISHGTTPF